MKHPIQIFRTALMGMVLGSIALNAQADSYEDGLLAYTTGNFTEAGQHLMSAADKGDKGAEHLLMRLFSEGQLNASNQDQEILKWTRKAAESGIKQAQYALGEIYAQNTDTMEEAVKWYRKAADQNHPDAYLKLGDILKSGAYGVDAHPDESIRLYQIAASEFQVFAQMGHAKYQFALGSMYQQAKGVKKDMTLALKWIGKAATQGHALAQLTLGRIYARGVDVPRNMSQARYWLDMAAAQGENEATSVLDAMTIAEEATVAFAM